MNIILASASKSRSRLLEAAGILFAVSAADIDEDAVKAELRRANASVSACAEALARRKAEKISCANRDALTIGADQMLECEKAWFDKPKDLAGARAHLVALRGKQHVLPTSVAVALNGSTIWHHNAAPRLTMRAFSDAFLDDYLAAVGTAALSSVGAYQLEGRGAQLFEKIDGDFFTILGLPLLELLAFLRQQGIVPR